MNCLSLISKLDRVSLSLLPIILFLSFQVNAIYNRHGTDTTTGISFDLLSSDTHHLNSSTNRYYVYPAYYTEFFSRIDVSNIDDQYLYECGSNPPSDRRINQLGINPETCGSYIYFRNSNNNVASILVDNFDTGGSTPDPDTTAPVISLIGSSSIQHEINTTYIDPGATANDNIDGDLTSSIVTVNNVQDTLEGSYLVTYNVQDLSGNSALQVTRTVNVFTPAPGNTAPVISLIGSSTITIDQDTTFTDPGATATDNEDGDLTSSIITTGSVTTSSPGTYTLTYSITDSGSLTDSITRTVIVNATQDPDPDPDPEPTTGSVQDLEEYVVAIAMFFTAIMGFQHGLSTRI
jgi:hypothetical protein